MVSTNAALQSRWRRPFRLATAAVIDGARKANPQPPPLPPQGMKRLSAFLPMRLFEATDRRVALAGQRGDERRRIACLGHERARDAGGIVEAEPCNVRRQQIMEDARDEGAEDRRLVTG